MTSRDFCYWLQGFFEIAEIDHGKQLTPAQVSIVRRHLHMVFAHEIDPSFGAHEQGKLDKIHSNLQGQQRPEHPFEPNDLGGSNKLVRC